MTKNNHDSTRRDFMAASLGAAAVATVGFNRLAQAQDAVNPVTVIVSFRIQEGQEDAALELLGELTSAVEENEPGALAYVAHHDQADPMKITFFEIYKDEAAVNNHRTAPHLQAVLPRFGQVFEQGAEVTNLVRVAGFTRQT